MAWLGKWLGNTCGGVWSNGVEQKKGTDEEHDEDCVEEEFCLDSVKFDRGGERGREALGTGNCSIKLWDGSELELVMFIFWKRFSNIFIIWYLEYIDF